jgi:hypothetical protein
MKNTHLVMQLARSTPVGRLASIKWEAFFGTKAKKQCLQHKGGRHCF